MSYRLCVNDGRVSVVPTSGNKSLPLSELVSDLLIGVFPEISDGPIEPTDTIIQAILKLEARLEANGSILVFDTYAEAVAGLAGREVPARVLIKEDEENNPSTPTNLPGKYDYFGTEIGLIEDIL